MRTPLTWRCFPAPSRGPRYQCLTGCLLVSVEGDTGARYTDIALRLIDYEVANAAWVTTLATLQGWVTMDKWPAFT